MARPKTYCTIDECNGVNSGHGLCEKHRYRRIRYGNPLHPVRDYAPRGSRMSSSCSIDGCISPIHAKLLCKKHYVRQRRHGDPTVVVVQRRSVPESIDGQEFCLDCERHLDRGMFYRSSRSKRGIMSRCKECARNAVAVWRGENPDRVRTMNDRWRDGNLSRAKAIRRDQRTRRREMELSAPGKYSKQQLDSRWAYYGGKCWMCGCVATQTDHVKPLAKGGSNWPSNLRPACESCNNKKRDKWPFVPSREGIPSDAGLTDSSPDDHTDRS